MPRAVVVGAGPNGLTAALTLARSGWRVEVLEADDTAGGGTRSSELTLPGFVHDVCSAVHPMALASPVLRELAIPWVEPEVSFAHPLDGDRAAIVWRSTADTAAGLGADGPRYRALFDPLAAHSDALTSAILSPFWLAERGDFGRTASQNVRGVRGVRRMPRPSRALVQYGARGVRSARHVARPFRTDEGRALLAGLAAHSVLPLDAPMTAGVALLLGSLAHATGWPIARGGSRAIADVLIAEVEAAGGSVVTGRRVASLREIDDTDAVVLDLTPAQVLSVAGDALPARYRRRLARYRYGPGVCKVDWALHAPIPWTNADVRRTPTVHVGGTFDEVAAAEAAPHRGEHTDRPFVIVVQPTVVDPSRAPAGMHTAWAYCHVPAGSTRDVSDAIEAQVERFAPGFRDHVVGRHVLTAAAIARRDPNRVGGDIGGGVADWRQLLARPTLSLHPWSTPVRGLYLCSAATPPGPGVHGMCGWHAAREVLRRQG